MELNLRLSDKEVAAITSIFYGRGQQAELFARLRTVEVQIMNLMHPDTYGPPKDAYAPSI
jgi:hypothetical protein